MEILDVEGLSLEISYVWFDFDGDLYYRISLKFNDQSIINPELLKREPEEADQPGGIIVVSGPLCRLRPLLKDALENDKADFWEDNNLSVTLAVYPNDLFPFLPSHLVPLPREGEDAAAQEEAPSDPEHDNIDLIVFVDTFHLKGTPYPSGLNVGINICPTRAELRTFYEALRAEFAVFYKRHEHTMLPRYYQHAGVPLPF